MRSTSFATLAFLAFPFVSAVSNLQPRVALGACANVAVAINPLVATTTNVCLCLDANTAALSSGSASELLTLSNVNSISLLDIANSPVARAILGLTGLTSVAINLLDIDVLRQQLIDAQSLTTLNALGSSSTPSTCYFGPTAQPQNCATCTYTCPTTALPVKCAGNCYAAGTQCSTISCPATYVKCADGCYPAGTLCSSGIPGERKRSLMPRRACAPGLTACATADSASGRGMGWECLDVRSDIESCGGCPYDNIHTVTGTDCTTLTGVNVVQCVEGQCVIDSCMRGWTRNLTGQCEPHGRFAAQGSKKARK